jgi:exosortase/archaeosortase family protein
LLALAVLGWRLWWVLAGPLLYLYFLVPFGAFLTPKLQDFTTVFVRHGLDLLQIPAYIDGYTIEIPEGTFYIAEACAGLRFLIASIAFGCLYALLMYRSPWRRVAFFVASIVVPIIANGIRAVGIVALGHLLGSAQAAATDHVLYGWIFFSLVILLLIALGLPFREDMQRPGGPSAPRPDPPASGNGYWRAAALAVGLVVVVAAVTPVLAMQLDRVGPPAAGSIPLLALGAGCADMPADVPAPLDMPGSLVTRRVACSGQVFDVRLDVFGSHSTAAPVLAAVHRLAVLPNPTEDEEIVTETEWLPMPAGPQRLWRLTRTTRPGPMIAIAIWVDGQPAAGGLATRARLAWTSLTGARIAPVVVAVSPELGPASMTPAAMQTIEDRLARLLAQADIGGQIERIVAPHD